MCTNCEVSLTGALKSSYECNHVITLASKVLKAIIWKKVFVKGKIAVIFFVFVYSIFYVIHKKEISQSWFLFSKCFLNVLSHVSARVSGLNRSNKIKSERFHLNSLSLRLNWIRLNHVSSNFPRTNYIMLSLHVKYSLVCLFFLFLSSLDVIHDWEVL